MKKLILVILLLVASVSFAQNMLQDTDGSYIDTVLIAGSTDAGTTWFKSKGFDVAYVQVFNGAIWYEFEVAVNVSQFDKFKLNMEGSDTTLSILGNTNDKNAGDISITLPVWSSSSTKVYSLDFGNGGTFGTSASPIVVRFRGSYK